MTDLVDDLERVAREHLLAAMPPDDRRLAAMDLATLMIEYRTWRARFIEPRPRRVHRSPALVAEQLEDDVAPAVAELEAELTAGADINPRLSATVHDPFRRVRDGEAHRSSDRDLLLADWGIHHLHLSATRRAGRPTTERTARVMFAVLDPDDAYLIGVFDHPRHANWASRDIFASMVRAFPDCGLSMPMRGVIGLVGPEPTDEERLQLRSAGVNQALEVDGVVHSPRGLGQTLGGSPVAAVRDTNAVMWQLHQLRDMDLDLHLADISGKPAGTAWRAEVLELRPGFEELLGLRHDDEFIYVGRLI